MYIIDGIAYAGTQQKPVKVIAVKPLDGYKLRVRFNDGRTGTFDVTPMLEAAAFVRLKDKATFDRVYVEFGAPVWGDGDMDISPEYVYEHTDFSEAEKGA